MLRSGTPVQIISVYLALAIEWVQENVLLSIAICVTVLVVLVFSSSIDDGNKIKKKKHGGVKED